MFLLAILFCLLVAFHKKLLQRFGFDPNRARDTFGFHVFIALPFVVMHGIIFKWLFFGSVAFIGVLLGFSLTLLENYFYFKKVRNNVLPYYSRQKKFIGVFFLIGIASWFLYKELSFSEFVQFIACLNIPMTIGSFVNTIWHEKRHGPLYLTARGKVTE